MKHLILSTIIALACAAAPITASTQTPPPEVTTRFAAPKLKGAATTRAWGLKLFDAELWMADGGAFSFGKPFALSLTYGTRFAAETIANSTISEIVRVEGGSEDSHVKLRDQLIACLPNVRSGLRITGVAENASQVSLYVNGRKACTMRYPDLRKRFFSIWLAPTSRDRKAAARLTGG